MITHKLSILQNFAQANLNEEPYPYIVMENAIEPSIYAELEHTFPGQNIITQGREIKDTWFDYPACKVVNDERITPLWREFFRYHVSSDFYREIIHYLGDTYRQLHPTLEARMQKKLEQFTTGMRPGGRGDPLAPGADLSLECQFYLNFTRRPRVVRGPHVDRPTEMFAALLYFRLDGDPSAGGDLQINRAKKEKNIFREPNSIRIDKLPAEVSEENVETINTVQYKPNTLIFFLNSARSIHSVSPRTPTDVTRRHINFCGDLTVDLFEFNLPARLKLKESLGKMPLGWRLAKYL